MYSKAKLLVILKALSRFWWYRSQLKCRIFVKGEKNGGFSLEETFKTHLTLKHKSPGRQEDQISAV